NRATPAGWPAGKAGGAWKSPWDNIGLGGETDWECLLTDVEYPGNNSQLLPTSPHQPLAIPSFSPPEVCCQGSLWGSDVVTSGKHFPKAGILLLTRDLGGIGPHTARIRRGLFSEFSCGRHSREKEFSLFQRRRFPGGFSAHFLNTPPPGP